MASSYSTDLKLELMVTGENAGTWGDKTNTNLNLVQQAIAGYESVSLTDLGTVTLTMSNAALSNARNMVLKFTGTLTGASTVTIPDAIEKFYIIDLSAVIGVTNLTIKTVSGTGFTAGEAAIVAAYSDGTNLNEIALNTLGGTIASAQIADNAITSAKISANAVVTTKISNLNVTEAKIADGAVTASKIAGSTITQAKLATYSVGPDQLISTGVTAAAYTNASVTVDADGRITAASSGAAAGGDSLDFSLSIGGGGPVSTTYTPLSPTAVAGYGYISGGSGNGGQRNDPVRPGGAGGVGGRGFFTINNPGGLSGQTVNIGAGGGSSQFGSVITAAAGNNGGATPPGNPGGAATPSNPGAPISPTPGYTGTEQIPGTPGGMAISTLNMTNQFDTSFIPLFQNASYNTDSVGNTWPGAGNGWVALQPLVGGNGGSPNRTAQNGGPGYMFFFEKNGSGF